MTRYQMIVGVAVIFTLLVISVVGIWSNRALPCDCTEHATEMARWVNYCSASPWQSTSVCIEAAQKIFCKPVCPNE